jgi:hypothetical protein
MTFVPKVLIGSRRTALVWRPKLPSPWVEHDEVLLQIHRAAGEDAGTGRDGERRGVVADLGLVEEGAAGVAADDMLEVEA